MLGHRYARSLILCSATPLLVVSSTSTASDNAPSARIYGGEIAKPCEFPTTVYAGGCTATLIHPRVVLSAGHCPTLTKIDFGESIRNKAKSASIKWCEKTPFSSTDAQICVLEDAIEGLPTAPILQGCEVEALKANTKVMLAGFGLDENDYAQQRGVDEKRWVETQINRVSDSTLYIGGGGKGGCQGDSGGPVYLKLSDGSWRTIGATHGGGSHPNCDEGMYKRTDKLISWYEAQLKKHGEDDIDLSPCFNDEGEWEATEACGGYSKDVQGPYGDWSNHCGEGMPVQRYSATCGKAFGPSDDETTPKSGQESQGPESAGASGSPSEQPDPSSIPDVSGESVAGSDDSEGLNDQGETEPPPRSGCSLQPAERYGAILTILGVIAWAQRRRRS